jgi:hypothetical protein
MADDKNRVPLFDGTNFSNWKFRMEALLDEKDLLELVTELYSAKVVIQEGDTEQVKKEKRDRLVELRKNDKKCKSQIIQRIADSHLEYVKDAETAYEMWSTLQTTFERKSMASQVLLRKKLLTMKFNVGTDSMNTHFLKFDGTIRELKSAGANLEQSDVVCHLLLTMPPEYDTVVTAIETLASEELTISFVKNRLLDEESKRLGSRQEKGKEASTSSAFVAPTRNKKFDGRSKLKCFNCGIIGHKKSECRKPKSKTEAKICEVNTELCFAGFAQGEADSSWYLDSGCTEHLAKSSNSLKNVRPLEKPIQIRSAKSGTFLTAKEMGDIPVKTVIGEQTKRITIKNVLVVPNLEFNLLSVRRLEMNGLKIIFENGNGNIFKNDELVAVAHRKEKLYELAFKLPDVECAAVASSTTDTAELWHKRLGHIGRTGLEKVKDLVDGMEVNLPKNSCICPVCVEGKQTKLPHVQLRTRAQRPLQLVHSDLMGPIQNEAYNEKQYILTFIDDYTHFVVVYLLETKSEVFKYFKQYEAMVNSHFERRISRLRCDNGREYLSNDMTKYLKSRGIQHELTIRYTPQQNGVAERMNRTLMERARCMLLGSKLEKCLWTEAILTAAYLVNRSPTSSLKDQVPAELWYGEKPNLNKLKIFGCVAYLRLPNEILKSKSDSRTKTCYMVGYCPNGYRLWCPQEKRIICGRDIVFDETKFAIKEPSFYRSEQVEEEQAEEETDEKDRVESNTETEEKANECRRSNRERRPPKQLEDYDISMIALGACVENVPVTYQELEGRPDEEDWQRAMNEEMTALRENETWTLEELPKGKKAIDCKWVFKIKRDETGNLDKYKARLVVKGCSQRPGIDYGETYAPVARLTTVKTLLSVINHKGLVAEQLDVKNAFLHGHIGEEIYMKPPPGLNAASNLVCKLKKSLYGLKQAPRAWNSRFDTFMEKLMFERSKNDKCLYVQKTNGNEIYLVLYVDDIILAGKNPDSLNIIKEKLKQEFNMTDLGKLRLFLGIKIDCSENGMFLSQQVYIRQMLKKFGMEECKPVKTPMVLKPANESEEKDEDIPEKPYRELVGSLMFLMLNTRPDISTAVNYYSRFQSEPKHSHWIGLKRILRYLQGTASHGLFYPRGECPALTCYADSDWAGGADRRSTSGFLIEVFGATVCWATKKQTTVALSSTEAEYVALATATTELLWLINLAKDLSIDIQEPVVIYEDNQSCIHTLRKWEHQRLKHVDVKYNFLRDLYQEKKIDVRYIQSEDQKADILTKPLGMNQFDKLRAEIGVRSE